MKFFTKISLLAILLTVVFNLNTFAQLEARESSLGKAKLLTRKGSSEVQVDNTKEALESPSGDVGFAPEVSAATNYAFATTTTGSLTDMSTGTTTLVAADQDDTASSVVNIGFDFYFMGVRYTQFSANSNGSIRLGGTAVTNTGYNPLAVASTPIITPYGADQRTLASTGKVHFKVTGAAGSRILIVEFLNMQADFNSGGASNLTYQARLSETTGVIEFVYGSMTMSAAGAADANSNSPEFGFSSSNTAGTVGSITAAQSGTPAPTFDGSSATPVDNLYVAGTIPVLTSATNGTRRTFSFTPPIPTSPTGLTFTTVTQTTYTLNWTDAPDERIYAIYRSTDGVNYTFAGTSAENATTFNATGLTPSVNYFWQVYSVSEGAFGASPLTGSQTTAAAGNDTCSGTPTNWTATTSWADGTVPTTGDNVTIQSGCTMIVDTATPTALNLTVQSGGTLRYHPTTASTLTLLGDVTVDAGGTFDAGTGVLQTHVLNIGGSSTASGAAGNLTVNGTFDMFTTASVTTNFFGSTNGTLSGAGATADFFAIVGQKGTNQTAILDVTRVITIASPSASGSRLTVNGGTIKISSATVATPWFGTNTITGANGRLWVNNAGASLQCVGTGVSATGSGSPTFTGGLRIDSGLVGYGQGNNTMTFSATTGSLVMNGGTLNMFGAILFSTGSSFTMTAGDMNIDPQNVTSIAATTNLLRFTGAVIVNASGGTMTIVDPHAATGTGKAFSISAASAAENAGYNFTGSTLRLGNGVSTTAGSVDGFDIDTWVGIAPAPVALGNVIVDNTATNAATRFVRSQTVSPFNQIYNGNLTITGSGGSDYRLNGNILQITGNLVNNGVFNGSAAGSILWFLGNGAAQTHSGTGTFTGPMPVLVFENALGVTLSQSAQTVARTAVLFTGSVTGSGKITLGNGDATVSTVQIGNTTTPTNAGSFDAPFTFNLGAGGQSISYLRTTVSRSTGPEVNPARTLVNLTYDDNDAAPHTLTVAGGNLTVGGTLALTNGVVVTNAANTLIHTGATATRTTGYVDGPLQHNFPAAAAYTYFVGQNGYSPVLATVSALGVAGDGLTVQANDAGLGGFDPAHSTSRNWLVMENGDVTTTLQFTYLDPADVNGVEADYRAYKRTTAGVITDVCGAPCVNTTNNTVTTPSITDFSRWIAGDANAALVPTAATVNIGGRVMMPDGITGLPRAKVVLTGGNLTEARTITTNPFGYYNFDSLPTGQTYVLTVGSKQYRFSPPSLVITPSDNIQNADFIARPPVIDVIQ
ncbi:MAG: G8 domain-containing protein [Pyrinomonadaceae bacterium]